MSEVPLLSYVPISVHTRALVYYLSVHVLFVLLQERWGRAVVVVSRSKARCTALYSFFLIYVPRSVGVPWWGSIFQVGSDDGLVCCFFDVFVAHYGGSLLFFYRYFICVFIEWKPIVKNNNKVFVRVYVFKVCVSCRCRWWVSYQDTCRCSLYFWRNCNDGMRARRWHTNIVYWNLIAFFVRLVIRKILHFLILNFICHVAAHSWSLTISFWSNLASFGQLISRYMALSSANNLIFDVRCCSMSFM